MIKKLLTVCILLLCLLPCCRVVAEGGEAAGQILEEYAQTYGAELQRGTEGLDAGDAGEMLPDFNAEELLRSVMAGGADFSVGGIVQWLFRLLWREIFSVSKLMVLVIVLALLSAYLNSLQDGLGGEGLSQVTFFACYTLIAGIMAAAFCEMVKCGSLALENMGLYMQVLIPLVITALLSSGAVLSAAVLEPTLLAVTEIILQCIRTFFLPMVLLTAAVNVVNGLSDKFNADKLLQLFNKLIKWGLSVLLLVFVGVAGVQSISAASADGLSVKVTKFAASNLIPVIGGILADSVETVVNCSILLKNAVGVVGVIVIAAVAAMPLIKIAAGLLLFRVSAAVVQPIADPKIVKGLSSLADAIGVLFAMVAAVAVMFIIVLAIMVNAGSAAVILGR